MRLAWEENPDWAGSVCWNDVEHTEVQIGSFIAVDSELDWREPKNPLPVSSLKTTENKKKNEAFISNINNSDSSNKNTPEISQNNSKWNLFYIFIREGVVEGGASKGARKGSLHVSGRSCCACSTCICIRIRICIFCSLPEGTMHVVEREVTQIKKFLLQNKHEICTFKNWLKEYESLKTYFKIFYQFLMALKFSFGVFKPSPEIPITPIRFVI